MALNTNNTKESKVRNYTLCKVCNFKGRKGNPLTTCILCKKQMHSKSSCATTSDKDSTHYICSLCKTKRRSTQSKTVLGRRSVSQIATPTSITSSNTHRRTSERDSTISPISVPACNAVEPESDVTSYQKIENELQRMGNLLKELQILCANHTTVINSLKQENQRLSEAVKYLQNNKTYSSQGNSQQPSTGYRNYSSIQGSSSNFYNFYNFDNNNNSTNINNEDNSNTLVHFNSSKNKNKNNNNKKYSYNCDIKYIDCSDNNSITNTHIFHNSNNDNNNTGIDCALNENNHNSIMNVAPTVTKISPSDYNTPHLLTNSYQIERREVFIPGFMKLNDESSMRCISFSILKTLLPSLNSLDICGVRAARPKLTPMRITKPDTGYTPIIVRLSSIELAQKIITARKSYNNNYFTTKDLDLTLLNSEIISALPDSRIFINEVLSTTDQSNYLSIKETAKKLGFKYIWHCSGNILVRWNNNMRSHLIRSVSDLSTIMESLGAMGPIPQPPARSTSLIKTTDSSTNIDSSL